MSQDVVLVCPMELSLNEFRSILIPQWSKCFVGSTSDKEFQLAGGDGSWYITFTQSDDRNEVAEDYASNALLSGAFRSVAADSEYYFVEYNDFNVTKTVIGDLYEGAGGWVSRIWMDNGYAVMVPAVDFLENIRRDPEWDWRKMQAWTVVIACPLGLTITDFRSILTQKRSDSLVLGSSGNELHLRGKGGGWFVGICELGNEEGAVNDRIMSEIVDKSLGGKADNGRYYMFRYDDLSNLKSVLIDFLGGARKWLSKIWIDLDHGIVMPGAAFLEKVRQDPTWDWTR